MERQPKPNEIYRHFKGNLYRIVTLARHSETGEMMVVYQALYGDFGIFVRPLEMFVSEVDHNKYPDAASRYRFTLVPQVMEAGGAQRQPVEENALSTAGFPAAGADASNRGEGTARKASGTDAAHFPDKETKTGVPAGGAADSSTSADEATAEEELSEEELSLDPMLMEFLDADNYRQKMNILTALHSRITDEMLSTMAVSMDLELPEGEVEERFQTIKNCIRTLEKYECQRLR